MILFFILFFIPFLIDSKLIVSEKFVAFDTSPDGAFAVFSGDFDAPKLKIYKTASSKPQEMKWTNNCDGVVDGATVRWGNHLLWVAASADDCLDVTSWDSDGEEVSHWKMDHFNLSRVEILSDDNAERLLVSGVCKPILEFTARMPDHFPVKFSFAPCFVEESNSKTKQYLSLPPFLLDDIPNDIPNGTNSYGSPDLLLFFGNSSSVSVGHLPSPVIASSKSAISQVAFLDATDPNKAMVYPIAPSFLVANDAGKTYNFDKNSPWNRNMLTKSADGVTNWRTAASAACKMDHNDGAVRVTDASRAHFAASPVPDKDWEVLVLDFEKKTCHRLTPTGYKDYENFVVVDVAGTPNGAVLALLKDSVDKMHYLVQLKEGTGGYTTNEDGDDGESDPYPVRILVVAVELLLGVLLAFGIWRATSGGLGGGNVLVVAAPAAATLEMEDADTEAGDAYDSNVIELEEFQPKTPPPPKKSAKKD